MSLTDLARQMSPPRGVSPASQGGAASVRVAEYVRQRLVSGPRSPESTAGYADGTVATVAWSILRGTRAYREAAMRLGATPAIWRLGDFVVTPLREGGVTRFVLLALDPSLPSQFSPAATVLPTAFDDLTTAHRRWIDRVGRAPGYGPALAQATGPEVVTEFSLAQGLQLVVAGVSLETQYTAERPTPPFVVKDGSGATNFSMGVYSNSTLHGPGLTTAAHGTVAGAAYDVEDGGTVIDSVKGIQTNAVLDAAFLQLSKVPTIASPAGRSFLSGVTPDTTLTHAFHGFVSGLTQASVSGWVDDLLTIEPWLQNRVFTQQILKQGDSGSALIDANDQVVGFAFYNSSAFASPTCSAWIWSDSVRDDFQLT